MVSSPCARRSLSCGKSHGAITCSYKIHDLFPQDKKILPFRDFQLLAHQAPEEITYFLEKFSVKLDKLKIIVAQYKLHCLACKQL